MKTTSPPARLSRAPSGFEPGSLTPAPLHDPRWRVMSLALDVSGRCNMACRYCAEAATMPRRARMTPETVQAAWQFLFPDGRLHSHGTIRLGSGEPLLGLPALQKIEQLSEQARQAGEVDLPAVFVTTNGTLLTERVAKWLVSTDWHIKISLDGPEWIHDAWRVFPNGKGSYRRVAAALERLVQQIPERLSVTAVLCHDTDPELVFDAIERMGVRRIELVPAVHRDASIRVDAQDARRYESFVNNYARRVLRSEPGEPAASLVRLENKVTRVMGYDNLYVQCGAGRSFFAVSAEGGLYPCFRFIGLDPYRLGDLASGLDATALGRFQSGAGRPYHARVACRKCWAAPLCGGPCFACVEMFGPGEHEPLPIDCAYVLADAHAAVWLYNRLRKRQPERLLSFLPHTMI